jgi:hypothetical protein
MRELPSSVSETYAHVPSERVEMAAPGVTSVKSFPYRGAAEEWSNQYHFVGDAPDDHAGWVALCTSLADLEVAILHEDTTILRYYCYEDTADDAVDTVICADESIDGTGGRAIGASEHLAPGDAAAWVRWKTARTNTHGKPIYLRKYFHGVILTSSAGDGDDIEATQKTDYGDFGGAINGVHGDWPGIAGPDGVAPGASAVSPFVTTRTLKRRGARPH